MFLSDADARLVALLYLLVTAFVFGKIFEHLFEMILGTPFRSASVVQQSAKLIGENLHVHTFYKGGIGREVIIDNSRRVIGKRYFRWEETPQGEFIEKKGT